MATFTLDDATIWVAGHDFTTNLNQVSLSVSATELDSTTFGGGGFRSRIAGLRSVQAQLAGFWDSPPDTAAFDNLGTADRVTTIAPESAETAPAYLFQAGTFTYQPFGQIGEVTPFSLDMMGANGVGVVRGQVAKAKGDVSSTGATGTGVQLGAVGASQHLYASLHTFAAGTTLTVLVESDDNAGFTTPTARATIGPVTTSGGMWMTRVAGPVTDTYYRLTVSAVTGTFSIAGAIGIG